MGKKNPTHCSWVQNHSSLFCSKSKSPPLSCLSASPPNFLPPCSCFSYTELAAPWTLQACSCPIAVELIASVICKVWVPKLLEIFSQMSVFKVKLTWSTQIKLQYPYSILHILLFLFSLHLPSSTYYITYLSSFLSASLHQNRFHKGRDLCHNESPAPRAVPGTW